MHRQTKRAFTLVNIVDRVTYTRICELFKIMHFFNKTDVFIHEKIRMPVGITE